jgi:glycosyltransferase involved in cell wall biosynthesis
MTPISVVIIAKNEADVIAGAIRSAKMITDDVIIVDSDSTDETALIALNLGCRVYDTKWMGYGATKNMGAGLAKYDWILSVDADEVPDLELVLAIHDLKLDDPEEVYDIRFKSWFGKKRIRFGQWGRDHHVRLFNRTQVRWSEARVHETLILPARVKINKLSGCINHYSVKNAGECDAKAAAYARLSARNYYANGRKYAVFSLYFSPIFGFFVNYMLFLGILDGKEGWQISKTIFRNKWLKYHYLRELENARHKNEFVNTRITEYQAEGVNG